MVLLTTALGSRLGDLLSHAQAAGVAEHWEQIRQKLRVNVVTLVQGIDRRRRGLDQQQSNIQSKVGALLAANWYSAVETCEGLLDETNEMDNDSAHRGEGGRPMARPLTHPRAGPHAAMPAG